MTETKNPKRICIAIHGLYQSGAERVAASWANYLAECGHCVTVMVYAQTETSFALNDRVRVLPLADTQEQYYQWPKLRQLSAIRKLMLREKPQIVISFLPKMQISIMLATLGLPIKRVETIRNNPWLDTDAAGKRFLWNRCFRTGDLILVQTKEQSEFFSKSLQKKCEVVSNPLSGCFVENRKSYGQTPITKFVAVARMYPQKNYPLMIRAFAQVVQNHPECTLDIYGAGSPQQIQQLQKLTASLGVGDSIRLCGWTKEISRLLLQYDAFLMSSDYEGMPNALAEAMATGLVCLSTDCRTGPKDMIATGKNGFLSKTGDVDSFAEGIETILNMDQQQCAEMGRLARESILQLCSEENTLARLNHLIETRV